MTSDPAAPKSAAAPSARRVHAITYEHGGDKYEVTVGKPRKVYPRQTGPRGGYIKNAGHRPWGSETGAVVSRIEDGGDLLYVWSEEPSPGWANPSYVGRHEIRSIAYFEAAPAEVGSPDTQD
jgi:hypothetical protein